MVEVSLTLLATAISTITAVTMATWFFCCWRKKGSRNVVAKSSSIKENAKKERSVSPGPAAAAAAADRAKNGLLSNPPALVVTGEDLGDFSDVQRETEILKSYRKPPPPKNRAPQSRAPRHLKNDTESLDIFTALSEEDGKNEIHSDKENIDPAGDPDSAVLRPRSEGQEKPTRETRSSMLMDIEQALATLHSSEPSATLFSGEGSLSEDKPCLAHFPQTVTKDIQDEKSQLHTGDFIISESKSCLSETLLPPEVKAEVASLSVALSPNLNHFGKPKQGPKVSPKPSPKPSPRASARMSYSTTANVELEKQTEPNVIDSLSLSQTFDNTGSSDRAIISQQISSSHVEMETTDIKMVQESTSLGLQTMQKSTVEITTNNIQSQTLMDNTESEVPSILADTTIRDDMKSEDVIDDTTEAVKLSGTTNTSENPVSDIVNDAEVSTDVNVNNGRSNIISEVGDLVSASQVQPASKTHVPDHKEGNHVPAGSDDSPEAETSLKRVEADGERDGTSLERETVSVQSDGDSGGSSEKNGARQEESTED